MQCTILWPSKNHDMQMLNWCTKTLIIYTSNKQTQNETNKKRKHHSILITSRSNLKVSHEYEVLSYLEMSIVNCHVELIFVVSPLLTDTWPRMSTQGPPPLGGSRVDALSEGTALISWFHSLCSHTMNRELNIVDLRLSCLSWICPAVWFEIMTSGESVGRRV